MRINDDRDDDDNLDKLWMEAYVCFLSCRGYDLPDLVCERNTGRSLFFNISNHPLRNLSKVPTLYKKRTCPQGKIPFYPTPRDDDTATTLPKYHKYQQKQNQQHAQNPNPKLNAPILTVPLRPRRPPHRPRHPMG